MNIAADSLTAALTRFGLSDFRPGQREVIETIIAGRDTLCVMPTGGGKSLCYQLPAILLPKPTLVVSPLIALMKDQEDGLLEVGVPAVSLHSNLSDSEQMERFSRITRGECPIVYVAPERFRSKVFLEMMTRVGVSLLAVDEAHCISEWGHDFRPDYARLGKVRQALGSPPTIALTATATDVVRRDIVELLNLSDPAIYIRGFDRPNLTYVVTESPTKSTKADRLQALLAETPGSIIVYCASRKSCEEVGELLDGKLKRSTTVYHAGLSADDRKRAQDRFMGGKVDVVVATNAFGMGVDKPDIRAVVHYNLPGSLEAYYQEAGRAGRDGAPARCELLFAYADRYIQEFFIDGEYPERRVIFAVLDFLRSLNTSLIELTRQEIKEQMGIDVSDMAIGSSLKILEQAKMIERLRARQNMALVRFRETDGSLMDRLPKTATLQRRILSSIESIIREQGGEEAYFSPEAWARSMEIDRAALVRAIHELERRTPLEYIPPFRGSATRVLDRKTPTEKAPIDFQLLAERKTAETQKLDRVFDFCRLTACRRQAILSYFGEKSGRCGNCDNCLGPAGLAIRRTGSTTPAATKELGAKHAANPELKRSESKEPLVKLNADHCEICTAILDGVEELRGRFGKGLIVQVLTGSQSKDLARFGLERRNCFGRLQNMTQAEAGEWVDALLSARFLEQQGDPLRPILVLTKIGGELLKGDSDHWGMLVLPASASRQTIDAKRTSVPRNQQTPHPGSRYAPEHRNADNDRGGLKAQPERQVKEREVKPPTPANAEFIDRTPIDPYQPGLFDQTSEPSTSKSPKPFRPKSTPVRTPLSDDAQPPTAKNLGIKSGNETPAKPPAKKAAGTAAAVPSAKPTLSTKHPHYHWTAELIVQGYSVAEAAEIRRLDVSVVLEHALAACRAGLPIPWKPFDEGTFPPNCDANLSLLRDIAR